MERIATMLLALALAVPVSAAAAGRSSAPSLRLVQMQPLRVAGRGFRPLERVRVVLRADTAVTTRRVVAGARGGFVVSFGASPGGDPCQGGLTIVASGASRDRAVTKLVPRECPPASP